MQCGLDEAQHRRLPQADHRLHHHLCRAIRALQRCNHQRPLRHASAWLAAFLWRSAACCGCPAAATAIRRFAAATDSGRNGGASRAHCLACRLDGLERVGALGSRLGVPRHRKDEQRACCRNARAEHLRHDPRDSCRVAAKQAGESQHRCVTKREGHGAVLQVAERGQRVGGTRFRKQPHREEEHDCGDGDAPPGRRRHRDKGPSEQ
mmetsp:Transcript_11403/g.33849  ORF Transcript_11403/g.33849 Transcript_11403/m.33849 type:complete len:207 (+) Transcript_11403:299-919(+)